MRSAARARRCPSRPTNVSEVRLQNTLTRRKDDLPHPPGPIRMYVCGPTVYARAHVGNARPFVLGMWLRSWLRATGYDVTLVHNITDINDKIYDAAPGASAELAERATQWYLQDTGDLGLGMPDALPKATEMVPEIVAAIAELIERGFAYAVDGDVYFRVARFPEYGQLSGQRPDQVEEQEPNPLKEDARDFALWKANKPGEDTSWESPWGGGRPGWHIECSVMAEELLGPVFEIHGGGLDLVFPHHENEVAQSRALGHEFARLWMHNGMLEFTDEKMSKSLGNVVSLRDAIDRWGRETLLVYFLTAHWRKPIDYSEPDLRAAEARAERFRDVFRGPSEPATDGSWERFAAALDDDFNTPEALAVMHEWRDHALLRRALDVFGLGSLAEEEAAPPDIHALAEQRAAARADGDFAEADRLREEIEGRGWIVRDVAGDGGFQLVPKA
jgi:cysteinyl-tRNA synthetase